MFNLISNKPITVAVSSCLLGERVRYDGEEKFSMDIEQLRKMDIELVSICPEVGIGLGVPRPPVQVVSVVDQLKVLGVNNPEQDITVALIDYARKILHQYPDVCGYIFKSRSPSCGVSDTPVFSLQGKELVKSSGLFAKTIIEHTKFPVVDENCLSAPECRARFLQAVNRYYKNKELNT